jgi:hypothetical protein
MNIQADGSAAKHRIGAMSSDVKVALYLTEDARQSPRALIPTLSIGVARDNDFNIRKSAIPFSKRRAGDFDMQARISHVVAEDAYGTAAG